MRIGRGLISLLCAAGATLSLSAQTGAPVTLEAGPDWIPLQLELDIVPGSALDFSRLGFHKGPAGSHGWLIATPDGKFVFENEPNVPQRFYGINLCFDAQYLSHEESNRLAERLMRLGYNTVRLHHYEGVLVEGQPETTSFNPRRLDQLDYLIAALERLGIYISTDLFTSRPVLLNEIGVDRPGPVGMDRFKILAPVHRGAWENWKRFSRALLDHVNPYTKRRYAEDPGLAWISLINEGQFSNFYADIRTVPEWQKAWNEWLARRYPNRQALASSWGAELKENEVPGLASVELPERYTGSGQRVRDCAAFLTATEVNLLERMRSFLRKEIGCRALITNTNGWVNHVPMQLARSMYDYVDDHFYIDHPQFLEKNWSLPSRGGNTNPLSRNAAGGRIRGFTRLFEKPFTITEYNYAGPTRFRGIGGILTGALGALQDWSGIWRFAYSHRREAMFAPAPMNYFDMASDPLGQASERASLCLYLRGDMRPAPHSAAVVMKAVELEAPPRVQTLAPRWHWVAWLTRIGTYVDRGSGTSPAFTVALPLGWEKDQAGEGTTSAYQIEDAAMVSLLRERGIVASANISNPENDVFLSETGEIMIDAPSNTMILETPKTAGGFAGAGQTVQTRDGVLAFSLESSDATLWVSSLDDQPIVSSRRLLLTHLTDLQNTGIQYREEARQVLLAWGRIPHLVRAGKAQVRVRLAEPDKMKVWALSTSGRRIAALPNKVENGMLQFEASIAGSAGAQFMYEIAPE